MLKRSLILVAALGLFGLIGFAVAQQESANNGFQSTNPIRSRNVPHAPTNSNGMANELSGGWVLRMNNGEVIGADLAQSFDVTLKTHYGEIKLNSDQIVSLRIIAEDDNLTGTLNTDNDESEKTELRQIVIATVSGDIISGESNFEALQLKLAWGTAKADADSIDFICNRKFGVMTIVNDQTIPSFTLSPIHLERLTTRIVDRTRSAQVIAPGRLTLPQTRRPSFRN
ncbi:hypothetical protein OAG68_01355 [bacterium]|nr:hypothetical protein [bacterium]